MKIKKKLPNTEIVDKQADLVKTLSGKIRSDLAKHFSDAAILDDNTLWTATRTSSNPRTPKDGAQRIHFQYRYPEPRTKRVGVAYVYPDNRADKISQILNYLLPALCGYCAAMEFLRSGDAILFDIFMDYFLDWEKIKTNIKFAKSSNGKISSQKRKRKFDPKIAYDRNNAGEKQVAIAIDLGVTQQRVSRAIADYKKQLG